MVMEKNQERMLTMLPQRIVRKDVANLPLPLLIAGGVLALVVLVFVGVALTMGSVPEQTEMTVNVPVE